MADTRPDVPPEDSSDELKEDVRSAVATLEEDEASEPLQQLLDTPEGRAAIAEVVTTAISVSEVRHSGPLPAPRTMREYEEIVPGGAERIFKMAELEQQHRHQRDRDNAALRNKTVDHVRTRELRGQIIGGCLAFSVLLLSTYMVVKGQYRYGVWLSASTMVAIAAVFAARQWMKRPPPPPARNGSDADE